MSLIPQTCIYLERLRENEDLLEEKRLISLLKLSGSGALSGKILLERIVEKNKIYAYFRTG